MDHICPANTVSKTEGLPIVWHNIEAPWVYLPLVQQEFMINCCLHQIFVGMQNLEVSIKDENQCRHYDYGQDEYEVCEEQAHHLSVAQLFFLHKDVISHVTLLAVDAIVADDISSHAVLVEHPVFAATRSDELLGYF